MGKLSEIIQKSFPSRRSREEIIANNKIEAKNENCRLSEAKNEARCEVKKLIESLSSEDIETKIYQLERSYLFEQNNLIDQFELEKQELYESFKQQKLLVTRAFENEKHELLKEIERKDKMLIELTIIMREEHEKKLSRQKEEIMNTVYEKFDLKTSIFAQIEKLAQIIEGALDTKACALEESSLRDFKDEYQKLTEGLRLSKELATTRRISNMDASFDSCISTRSSTPELIIENESSVQHELAQAYRRQKSELMKLFGQEKEEYRREIEEQQKRFERDTRVEYETRMAVERKAWQDTIEDYEREVSILKFEREQMDRNYCIGMDELKTEFEREKAIMFKKYFESGKKEKIKRSASS